MFGFGSREKWIDSLYYMLFGALKKINTSQSDELRGTQYGMSKARIFLEESKIGLSAVRLEITSLEEGWSSQN